MTLRVAVVGAGFIGADHATAYAAQPDAELVAVVDPDPGRAADLAGRSGATAFTDVDGLLAEARPDAASVCVPTGLHRVVVERLAAAGVHV
ncbi:MAG TPA: Gfo/Idh/MocA family oxidoreductase, partial [Candidatus Limnocylindrales bacterium]